MRNQFRIGSMVFMLGALAGCNSEAEFSGGLKKSYDVSASRVFNFVASQIVDGEISIEDGGRYISTEITQAEKSPSRVTQRQIRRQTFSDAYIQGHKARFSRESFQLSEAGMLDFLIVVDDSRSMKDEQAMVGKGLASLISAFELTNWQIAVVSTSDPCINASNLIKKGEPDADKKFANAMDKSIDWQATEQGFPMAIKALKGECRSSTRSWLRPGASLGVLFISDENNCGSDPGEQDRCRNVLGKNTSEMLQFLWGVKAKEDSKIYAIVDKDGTCKDAAGIGNMYVEAAASTGGSAGSICHDFNQIDGYGTYLKSVSTDVSRIIKRQFTLSASPDMAQFNVTVDGATVDPAGALSVRGNTVSIDPSMFKSGKLIEFSYTHDGVPMFSEVPVRMTPAPGSLRVIQNGIELRDKVEFSLDVGRRMLVFKSSPPEDAKLQISYTEDRPLDTKFNVDLRGARLDTVDVTVNGQTAAPASYVVNEGGIEFVEPPTEGGMVGISWRTEGHKILSYRAPNMDRRKPETYAVTDKVSGQPISATWDGSNLTFLPEEILEGRKILLTFDFGVKKSIQTVELPSERIDDKLSVVVDGDPEICKEDTLESVQTQQTYDLDSVGRPENQQEKNDEKPSWKSRYKGRQVTLRCVAGKDYKKLAIKYRYETGRTNVFKVGLPPGMSSDDPTVGWKVYVNHTQVHTFVRDGSDITLEENMLEPEAKIDVEVISYTQVSK